MRIIIAGGSGLLGANLAAIFSKSHEVLCLSRKFKVLIDNVHFEQVDLGVCSEASRVISLFNPDLLINTAGFTGVEQCELHPYLAQEGNITVAENLAKIALENNIRFIHLSTDHLFDGNNEYYDENSVCHPLNEYARTKYKAEKKVLSINPSALVLRVNFFGHGMGIKSSFSDWVIDNLSAGKKIYAYEDVYITPLIIDVLAAIMLKLASIEVTGILNVVSDEKVSKYKLAQMIAGHFGLDSKLIVKIKYADASSKVVRPLDMSLSNAKLKKLLARRFKTNLQDSVRLLIKQEAWTLERL